MYVCNSNSVILLSFAGGCFFGGRLECSARSDDSRTAARGNSTELLSINERHRCRQAWWLVAAKPGERPEQLESLQDHRHLHHPHPHLEDGMEHIDGDDHLQCQR